MSYRTSTLVLNKVIATNNYSVTENDFTVSCDATFNPVTVTLPDCRDVVNQLFSVCVTNLSHTVMVDTVYGLINNLPTFTFNGTVYRSIIVQSIGSKYVILASHDIEIYGEIIGDELSDDEIF